MNERAERIFEEEKKKREEDQRNLKTSIKDDLINLRILMFQDYRRDAEEKDRKLETIRSMDFEAREYLKSLANEFMSRMEEREDLEEQKPIEKRSKIDGKKSLKRGLETQIH